MVAGGGGIALSFHGGAGTVTGSRHLLEVGGRRVLVDCGLFQGLKELRLLNWRPPGFDPRGVDALILTHAHIDHAGYIPRLVREGFGGPVHCTEATQELSGILLLDAARLQEEDAEYANRKGHSKHVPAQPLYTRDDATRALRSFAAADYGQAIDLGEGSTAMLHNAGHVLGSAFAAVTIPQPGGDVRVVFSGDIGRYGVDLHPDPDPRAPCDVLVIESTYGERLHDRTPFIDQIRAQFTETVERGGTVLIPSFALARTQLVTLDLEEQMDAGQLPRVPIHIDSPMATAITKIYAEHSNTGELDPDVEDAGGSRLRFGRTVQAHVSVEESKELNGRHGPRVIVASSGMLTGGRVLHHLRYVLPDPKNLVMLVGYQAAGTRGRALVEGAKALRVFGEDVPVRARVLPVEGMSAHADADELMRWLHSAPMLPREVFVTHGERDAAEALARRIEGEGVRAHVPALGERFELLALLAGDAGASQAAGQ